LIWGGRGKAEVLGFVEAATSRVKVPAAYGGRVVLVSEQDLGVTVFWSGDGKWRRAENLGTIRSGFLREFERILPTTVQVGMGYLRIVPPRTHVGATIAIVRGGRVAR
jgi:hypothetical protein